MNWGQLIKGCFVELTGMVLMYFLLFCSPDFIEYVESNHNLFFNIFARVAILVSLSWGGWIIWKGAQLIDRIKIVRVKNELMIDRISGRGVLGDWS